MKYQYQDSKVNHVMVMNFAYLHSFSNYFRTVGPFELLDHLNCWTVWPFELLDHLNCWTIWTVGPFELLNHLNCWTIWTVGPLELLDHLNCWTIWYFLVFHFIPTKQLFLRQFSLKVHILGIVDLLIVVFCQMSSSSAVWWKRYYK